jgi:hypothetical protein
MFGSMIGDSETCRERANYCARLAATCPSRELSDKYAILARTWLYLSVQLEEQRALLSREREAERAIHGKF